MGNHLHLLLHEGEEELSTTILLDVTFVLGLFSENQTVALEKLIEFNEAENRDDCLKEERNSRLTDQEAREEILKIFSKYQMAKIKSLPREDRDQAIRQLRDIQGMT